MIPVPKEISDVFVALGFPSPAPIPVMSVSHQISQKLHGLSEPGRQRVQDLVDLQLMVANETIDFRTLRKICVRLFANRKMQAWPTSVIKDERWESLYDAAKLGVAGIRPLDEAIAWINDLIAKIDDAR